MSATPYLLIEAAFGRPTERRPIWLMRQAGRYLKEYREVRAKTTFLGLCKTPDLATIVTLQPVDLIGVDAAIIFSDILIPLEAMGLHVEFTESGPVLSNVVRSRSDVERLIVPTAEEKTPFVMQIIRQVRKELERRVPTIGFSGAPFTLLSYAVDGGNASELKKTKPFLMSDPQTAHALLQKIADTVVDYANAQIRAGAQAFQLFDTWAGMLSEHDYLEFAWRWLRYVVERIARRGVPLIVFVKGGSPFLYRIRELGADVVSVDWTMDIARAKDLLGPSVAIQGNLDPHVLYAPPGVIEERAGDILNKMRSHDGFIFNLGHGIMPDIPVEHVRHLVAFVKGYGRG